MSRFTPRGLKDIGAERLVSAICGSMVTPKRRVGQEGAHPSLTRDSVFKKVSNNFNGRDEYARILDDRRKERIKFIT